MYLLQEKLRGSLDGPILITGHTGFKGTWLTLLLEKLGIDAIGFQLASFEKELAVGVFIDIVFQISANTYMNRTTLQLVLQDMCMSA